MADDPVQSVADPIASDPNIIPPPESANSPTDRPVSTILADSPTEAKTPLADPGSDYTASTPVPDESTVATESASLAPSSSTVPADSESQTPADSQTTVPDESSVATQSATVPTEIQGEASPPPVPVEIQATPIQPAPQVTSTLPPEPTEGGSIPDFSHPNQPIQVQSEAPVAAPEPQASPAQESPLHSAEIKPEPPQGTQPAPLADLDSQKSSFGDILVGTGEASAPVIPVPVPPPPIPQTSFGDLVGKPPIEEPTINIEPIESPKPIQPSQPPAETVIEAKADFSAKRQQALQSRRRKRDDHLVKILALISQKGTIHNNDIVTNLRVSQSTATNYLHSLVKDGKIKKEGKAKATIYSL